MSDMLESDMLELYAQVFDENPWGVFSEDDRLRIADEMRKVLNEAHVEEAAGHIEWWGAWPNPRHESAVEAAADIRATWYGEHND